MIREKNDTKTDELQHVKEVAQTLFDIANAVNTTSGMESLYLAIYHSLGLVIDVTNLFLTCFGQDDVSFESI